MKVGDIKLGEKYLANVDGSEEIVTVIGNRPGGWLVRSTSLGKKVIDLSDFIAKSGKPKPLIKVKPSPELQKVFKHLLPKKPLRTVEKEAKIGRPKRPLRISIEEKKSHQNNMSILNGFFSGLIRNDRSVGTRAAKPSTRGLGPHTGVRALAGTGKTTSLIEGVRVAAGQKPRVHGSEQQLAIWEVMSRGRRPRSTHICAFNRAIAGHLAKKVPPGVGTSTMHSLALKACRRAYKIGDNDIQKYKTGSLLEERDGIDIRQLRDLKPLYVSACQALVGKLKQTVTEPEPDNLDYLADRYDIDCGEDREEVYKAVADLYDLSKRRTNIIDYDDMIWLPIVNKLPVFKIDHLLVDEAQDLNRAQQLFAMLAGLRITFVGDPHQAIYGFAGADTESMNRMETSLGKDCEILPLTITRRCGRAIVDLAKQIVPEFEAHEDNVDGLVRDTREEDLIKDLREADFVLCRVNAPLVSLVFKLLKHKRKATIQGRDIGDQFMAFIKNFKAGNIDDLVEKVNDYQETEIRRLKKAKHPADDKIDAIADKCECVRTFCEGTKSLAEMERTIGDIFKDGTQPGILLSSIHRAKGMEAKRVHIIKPEKLPHPMATKDWQLEQEKNLKYVAETRAIEELYFVHGKGR
jgi:DNA helicase-2/ATP-dependent DNA helicase PcrA